MEKWSDSVDLELSKPVSRSLRIEGYSTSVRLEAIFWRVLDSIARDDGQTTATLLGEIYRIHYTNSENHKNFASLLRVICARHLDALRR
ncbi:MAG: ribbon-helix-helix domain-containing protein [SAR324 cluster bacterium]|nr:ribbon-helix-helix domain-containing protein [SAR324 cluster bacterium]